MTKSAQERQLQSVGHARQHLHQTWKHALDFIVIAKRTGLLRKLEQLQNELIDIEVIVKNHGDKPTAEILKALEELRRD